MLSGRSGRVNYKNDVSGSCVVWSNCREISPEPEVIFKQVL